LVKLNDPEKFIMSNCEFTKTKLEAAFTRLGPQVFEALNYFGDQLNFAAFFKSTVYTVLSPVPHQKLKALMI